VWRILVLICCSAIDVGIEKTKFSESEKRIIHFVFWRAFAESLEERRSKADLIVFKKDIDDGFETIKSLILDPTPYSSPGSLGQENTSFLLFLVVGTLELTSDS